MRLTLVVLSALTLSVSACSSDPAAGSDADTSGFVDATSDAPEVFEPYCRGTPPPCGTHAENSNLCILTTGCQWRPKECSGTADSCRLRTSLSCDQGLGCYWSSLDQECKGSAAPCDVHDELDCEAVGCDFQRSACTGTPVPCDTYTTATTCGFQVDCEWIDSPPPTPDTHEPDTSAPSDIDGGGDSSPDTTRPDSIQPDSTTTDTTQPDSTTTDTTQPDSTTTDTTQPDSTPTDSTQPDTTQPDSTPTDTTQPDSTPPDSTQPARVELELTAPAATNEDAQVLSLKLRARIDGTLVAPHASFGVTVSGDVDEQTFQWPADTTELVMPVEIHDDDIYQGSSRPPLLIRAKVASTAGDARFASAEVEATASIVDDEQPGLIIEGPADLELNVARPLRVRLTSRPQQAVRFMCTATAGGLVSFGGQSAFGPPPTFEILPDLWQAGLGFSVELKSSDNADISITCESLTANNGYSYPGSATIVVPLFKRERLFEIVDSTLDENQSADSATLTVKLRTQPTAATRVACTVVPRYGNVVQTGLVILPSYLEFGPNDYQTPKPFTIVSIGNPHDEGSPTWNFDVRCGSHSVGSQPADTAYQSLPSKLLGPFRVTGNDDVAGLSIEVQNSVTTEAGGTGTFLVSLRSTPRASVSATFRVVGATDATVAPFSSEITDVPTLVTVTGKDDLIDDDDQAYIVRIDPSSSDPAWTSLANVDVPFTSIDGVCLNGIIDGDEECDRGEHPPTHCSRPCEPCSDVCTVETDAYCGDGQVSAAFGERCDGNLTATCADRRQVTGTVSCGADCSRDTASCSGTLGYTKVVAGTEFSCALSVAGTIDCWGGPPYDVRDRGPHIPPAGAGFIDVDAGLGTACGVRTSGDIVCWGQGDVPPDLPAGPYIKVIVINDSGVCGMRADGSIACGGKTSPTGGALVAPSGTGYKAFDGGETHACAVTATGGLACWGPDYAGETSPPLDAAGYTDVSCGYRNTCVLQANKQPKCFGLLPDSSYTPPGPSNDISNGRYANCVVQMGGSLYCTGLSGQAVLVEAAGTGFTQVAAGKGHACALRNDKTIVCWGHDRYGETWPTSARVHKLTGVSGDVCGIMQEGRILCTGVDSQLLVPPTSTGWIAAAGSARLVCALKSDGLPSCWAHPQSVQAPAAQAPAIAMSDIVVGHSFACGLKTSTGVVCWGSGTASTHEPTTSGFVQLVAASSFACALNNAGEITCWGNSSSRYPLDPPPTEPFRRIQIEDYNICGLTMSNRLQCWLSSGFVDLAGPFASLDTPRCALTMDGAVTCAGPTWYEPRFPSDTVSFQHGCGITADGRMFCKRHGRKCGSGVGADQPCMPGIVY